MGLFVPIIGGFLVLGIIVIFIFALFSLIVGFLVGGLLYLITGKKDIGIFKTGWIFTTAIIIIIGLSIFISLF